MNRTTDDIIIKLRSIFDNPKIITVKNLMTARKLIIDKKIEW